MFGIKYILVLFEIIVIFVVNNSYTECCIKTIETKFLGFHDKSDI